MSACCNSPPARTTYSMNGWCPTTCALPSPTRRCCGPRGCSAPPTARPSAQASARWARRTRGVRRRAGRNPLGSAAGYGTPGLPLDRDATTRALGFDSTQEPVTAVQLSRGKAEAQLLFEATLLMQDLGRLATDLLLFYTQEFAFVDLPEAFTTGSSIMPQKRNPDVLELLRGRSSSALACLTEALSLCAKLPSGYQRDMQLLKAPLFRGIDLCAQSIDG